VKNSKEEDDETEIFTVDTIITRKNEIIEKNDIVSDQTIYKVILLARSHPKKSGSS
jgi:hypothetical protein